MVLWYENYDLTSIVTPVKVEVLRRLLIETKYDRSKTEFLVNGFTSGFTLGYQGPQDRRTYAKNHKLRAGNKVVLWNKIMKEVREKRVTGPHLEPPYDSFIQSPITLIEKKGSTSNDPVERCRLIYDLSWPHGESLNDYTPKEVKSVDYPSFDKAVQMCLKEGKGCYLSRTDCKSAFLMLPLAPDQFKWLVIMCPHPVTGRKFYFSVKTVCFGSGTSCFLYMKLSNALAHIFRTKSGGDINNFLDDFLTCKIDRVGCNSYLQVFIDICDEIQLPLAEEKTCLATQIIVFLGLLINTLTQTISLPQDKLERGRRELDVIIRSKKITVHQLQRLTGLLNFFSRAVVPGRAFTRRLYAKTRGLRSYHHLRVDREMKKDCKVWLEFLKMDEAVCRPFMDFLSVLHADEVQFYTDGALDFCRYGIGGHFGNRYFTGSCGISAYAERKERLNIQIIELFSLTMGLYFWIDNFRNRRVVVFCDNESVVHMINKTTSSCSVCMIMIRMIVLWSMRFNTRIFCTHLKSEENFKADFLSRNGESSYLRTCDNGPVAKERLPPELWPLPLDWLVDN